MYSTVGKTTEEIERDHAVEYMRELKANLIRMRVTKKRLREIGGTPLTAMQVAYAIKMYVVEIEKRKKAK